MSRSGPLWSFSWGRVPSRTTVWRLWSRGHTITEKRVVPHAHVNFRVYDKGSRPYSLEFGRTRWRSWKWTVRHVLGGGGLPLGCRPPHDVLSSASPAGPQAGPSTSLFTVGPSLVGQVSHASLHLPPCSGPWTEQGCGDCTVMAGGVTISF